MVDKEDKMTRERWIKEFEFFGMKRIEDAIRKCDAKKTILYALDAQESLDTGFRTKLLTSSDYNKLKDAIRTTSEVFDHFCNCAEKIRE